MVYHGFGLEYIYGEPERPFNELTPEEQGERGAQRMIDFMGSCPGKSIISGATGFALGGVLGLFMASMSYDTPLHTPVPPNASPVMLGTSTSTSSATGALKGAAQATHPSVNVATAFADLPLRQQVKLQFSDMAKRSYSSAKNFGYIGAIYAGVECCVESLRAQNDIYNGISAGCLTGAGLAYKQGPQAALIGCAGFAAFSAAIDTYMKSEDGTPPPNDFK